MLKRDYVCDIETLGRNSWFRHKNFIPSVRPNIKKNCYKGAFKHDHVNRTTYC